MKTDNFGFVCAAIVSWILLSPAQSAEISKQAFQAEYELNSSLAGKSVHKLSCDGKGHGRSEMISARSHNVSILNYAKHQIFILNPQSKTVVTLPLTSGDVSGLEAFGQKIRSTGKPLGVKVIDGHTCTGTHYDLDGGSIEEIWTGNDIGGTRVYSKVTMPKIGVSESRLKAYSSTSPAAESFTIPSGYRTK